MIRNHVRKIMDELGVGIKEVSEQTGLNRSVVGRMYRNEVTSINLNVLDALCADLNVPVGWMLEYIPDESMTDDDHAHIDIRNSYAKRTSSYWERYKNKKAPHDELS